MTNKDVTNALNWCVDFISVIANGISAAIHVIPDVVIGIIAIILFGLWLFRKAHRG